MCVITRVETYLNSFKASHKSVFGDGRVARRDDEIGAGVARIIFENGPNVDVEECNV